MTGLASSTKPSFGTLEWQHGEHHIFVLDADGLPAAMRLLDAPHAPAPASIDILLLRPCGMADDRPGLADILRLEVVRTEPELLSALEERLETASMTTQLYLAGVESLVLEAMRCGLVSGMRPDAIRTELRGAARRHAQCAHCKTVYRNRAHRAFLCDRCNLTIVVRDHYSKRIGAYQAVMIDPEDLKLPALLAERFE